MFSTIALFSWPVVTFLLFLRFDAAKAVSYTVIFGYLFLPTLPVFNLPVLPEIDKNSIPTFSAVIMAVIIYAGKPQAEAASAVLPGWLPKSVIGRVLIATLFVGAFLTIVTNGDRLTYGSTRLPGLEIYSAFSSVLQSLVMLLPFLLGRKFLASDAAHHTLLFALCTAGVAYSLLVLFEVRMSPQLNKMVYGYFPSGWKMHLRGDGFRPIVFLRHGLWLGIFLSVSLFAAIGIVRTSGKEKRARYIVISLWMLATLVLSKNLGALLITLCVLPIALLLTARVQMLFAASIAAVILIYPMMRGSDLIPVDRFVSLAEQIDPSRAKSLQYRLNNEDILLEKANQRPVAGWGGWNRARVFDEKGNDISTTDGLWVIVIGKGGWVRYIAEFGLMGLPILLLAFRGKYYEVSLATSILCLILVVSMIDLIPNATRTPVTWLIVGAVMGRVEWKKGTASVQPENEGIAALRETREIGYARSMTASRKSPYTRHPQVKTRLRKSNF